MANKDTQSIDPNKVQAVSLDDWEVTPVGIDDWVVDDAEEAKPEAVIETTPAAQPVDATAETLVVPPEPVKAEKVESVDIDDWLIEDEEVSETKHLQVDISDDELAGPIEVDDNTFAESGSINRETIDNKTQVMDVGLQGDLAELEETSLDEISIESKTETPDEEEVEDDEDLLSDIDEDPGMQLNEDPFEPDEPVPSIGDIEFPPTTMQNVELDFDSETVIEETEISKEEVLEASLDADAPVPSVSEEKVLEFPPTSMTRVELDFNSETAIQEMEEAKAAEAVEEEQVPQTSEETPESQDQDDELEVVESEVDLDLDEGGDEDDLNLDDDIADNDELEVDLGLDSDNSDEDDLNLDDDIADDDELEVVESKIDLDLVDEDDDALQSAQVEHDPEAETIMEEPLPEPTIADAATAIALSESDLAPPSQEVETPSTDLAPAALKLDSGDLAETHWIKLTELDLAENHQLGVLRLTDNDLRENSDLPVIRLHEHDFAETHRKVIELDPNFFEENDIKRDAKGVILLKADDLVDPSVLDEEEEEEERAPRDRKRKKRETKESFFTDAMIVKICAIVIVFCLIAIPIRFHFKYSWVTVSESKYEEIKANTSSIDWLFKTMFEYRTPDSSMRWYGKRTLNSKAYSRAEDDGAMMWLWYEQGGRKGDDYP